MTWFYIGALIYITVFMIATYFSIEKQTKWGMWLTMICLWLLAAVGFYGALFR